MSSLLHVLLLGFISTIKCDVITSCTNSNTCSCQADEPCTIDCNGDDTCDVATINIGSATSVNINYNGIQACEDTTFNIGNVPLTADITCTGLNACHRATFNGGNHGSVFTIICSGGQDSCFLAQINAGNASSGLDWVCDEAIFNCGVGNGPCNIHCNGEKACADVNLDCNGASECTLRCDYGYRSSCQDLVAFDCGISSCSMYCDSSTSCLNSYNMFPDTITALSFECIGTGCTANYINSFLSQSPTNYPSSIPSKIPSNIPSTNPTNLSTNLPTNIPTLPTIIPSNNPSIIPTMSPSNVPTINPSEQQLPSHSTVNPSSIPSNIPSIYHSSVPTKSPLNEVNVKETSDSPMQIPTETEQSLQNDSSSPYVIYIVIGLIVYKICVNNRMKNEIKTQTETNLKLSSNSADMNDNHINVTKIVDGGEEDHTDNNYSDSEQLYKNNTKTCAGDNSNINDDEIEQMYIIPDEEKNIGKTKGNDTETQGNDAKTNKVITGGQTQTRKG